MRYSYVFLVGSTIENDEEWQIGDDGKPYATLGYTNGPGYRVHRTQNGLLTEEIPRRNLSSMKDAMCEQRFVQSVSFPWTIYTMIYNVNIDS